MRTKLKDNKSIHMKKKEDLRIKNHKLNIERKINTHGSKTQNNLK